jgi:hypothetical protein
MECCCLDIFGASRGVEIGVTAPGSRAKVVEICAKIIINIVNKKSILGAKKCFNN